jgi:hypothetical protein
MAKKQVGEPPRLARILRDEMLRSPAKFKLQTAHYAWMFQTPTQADHMALCEIIALHSLGAESFDPTNIFYRLAACNLNMAKAYHCRKQLITVDGATLPTTNCSAGEFRKIVRRLEKHGRTQYEIARIRDRQLGQAARFLLRSPREVLQYAADVDVFLRAVL